MYPFSIEEVCHDRMLFVNLEPSTTRKDISSMSQSEVARAVVYFMLVGRPVRRGDAEKVLAALSSRLRLDLDMNTVNVVFGGGRSR